MIHKDPASEHEDCKAHNAVMDKGGETAINIAGFKMCR